MGDRFEKIYTQGVMTSTQIWVDRETGVQYLFRQDGHAGGLCPLVDRDGKPLLKEAKNDM